MSKAALKVANLHAHYMARAFTQQRTNMRKFRRLLEPYTDRFELLVGSGISGALMVPLLAYHLRKRFAIVRKPSDNRSSAQVAPDASHSGREFEGTVAPNDRWLFVDDFMDTGRTFKRTIVGVQKLAQCGVPAVRLAGAFLYMGNGTFGDDQPRLILDTTYDRVFDVAKLKEVDEYVVESNGSGLLWFGRVHGVDPNSVGSDPDEDPIPF